MSQAITELVLLSEQLVTDEITPEQYRLRVSSIILNLTRSEVLTLAKILTAAQID